MKIIPENVSDAAGVAQAAFASALAEKKTTFLLFRCDTANEREILGVATKAEAITKWSPAEYRVILLKKVELLPAEIIANYFGSDPGVVAVSLCYGTGEPRKVGKRYQVSELPDGQAIGEAFAEAGA